MKQNDFRSFLKNWLIQLLIFLLIINLFNSIDYLIRMQIYGIYHTNPDGSPVTLWQRLMVHNFQTPDNLYLLALTILAEVNHHFIYNRFRWFIFLAASILFSAMIILLFFLTRSPGPGLNPFRGGTVVAAYLIGYSLLRSFIKHRLYRLQVRLNHSENELQVLKQQMHPHFLFNTLNYLYGTALQEKAHRTAEGIEAMSAMLRHSIAGMQEAYVTLESEIKFIKQYIQLYTVRLSQNDRTQVRVNIEGPDRPYNIAPMLLIPLIENAFKYGLLNESNAFIDIHLTVTEEILQLKVKNSTGPETSSPPGTGSGLALTAKRLELLYPKKYSLRVIPGTDVFEVLLDVKLS